ncbi:MULTISPECIES: AAA family ATPase [Moorena]|uniref:Nuclease SbcCD subunit C n=2 Tax=Moorena TaxID=1155738 RepID=A0A1U7MWA0_9CYAN|nr:MULTISPECIES: AAA family ATPase [Moorena]NEO14797.1 AAA family ATPase [Moorena sp. SIO3E8]NEP97706.1 AAA family ATPase [Moorena sp. SIO3F7]OLT57973.1 ATP-binding protein [Moorena bouillonii PNG]
MKLLSIQLCNFRQFYGKTPVIVLASGEQNTTIIHGNNGAGKTTILNAFSWVLYEKFSAAFASEDQLLNKRALAEAQFNKPVDCWVEVAFEHNNKRYQVKRLCRTYKTEVGVEQSNTELYLQIAGDDGRWLLPQQLPEDIIGQILPASLHQYFFFDGERIEQLVRSDKKSEVAEATKTLLGVEVLNRSIKHLREAKKTLDYELSLIGDSETKQLLKQQRKSEKTSQSLLKRQREIKQELEDQDQLKKTIGQRLLELGGAQELQQLRDELEAREKLIREQLKQSQHILKRAISTRGYTVLLSEVSSTFQEIVKDLITERGELPVGIKRQFVGDLLKHKRCICGVELTEGTHAHQQVAAWMDKAGMAEVEETAIRMGSQVDEISQQVPEFWQDVDQQQDTIAQGRTELSRIETQLDDIKKKLRNFPDEDISLLQQQLDEIDTRIRELTLEQGGNQQQLEQLDTDIDLKDKQIAKHKMNESKQALIQRRIAAAQDSIERLIEVRERLETQFRTSLEKRVQEIFISISFTPYIPKLSDKYELTLVESTLGAENLVAASTGENQILSLSFIGGIIDRVRDWSQEHSLMGPDSSTFPIVMDSPFGSLDEIYRRRIAHILPRLANQLVVLVTQTQWRGEVADEILPFLGKEYVLTYNSPKSDCEEDIIELAGNRYDLVRRSPNQFEYTEIIEVDYDS